MIQISLGNILFWTSEYLLYFAHELKKQFQECLRGSSRTIKISGHLRGPLLSCVTYWAMDVNLPTISRNEPIFSRTTEWGFACLFSQARSMTGHYMWQSLRRLLVSNTMKVLRQPSREEAAVSNTYVIHLHIRSQILFKSETLPQWLTMSHRC